MARAGLERAVKEQNFSCTAAKERLNLTIDIRYYTEDIWQAYTGIVLFLYEIGFH